MQTQPQVFEAKPEMFDTLQYDGTLDSADVIKLWVRENGGRAVVDQYVLTIATPLGTVPVVAGDWVIRMGRNYHVFPPAVFVDLFRPA